MLKKCMLKIVHVENSACRSASLVLYKLFGYNCLWSSYNQIYLFMKQCECSNHTEALGTVYAIPTAGELDKLFNPTGVLIATKQFGRRMY